MDDLLSIYDPQFFWSVGEDNNIQIINVWFSGGSICSGLVHSTHLIKGSLISLFPLGISRISTEYKEGIQEMGRSGVTPL